MGRVKVLTVTRSVHSGRPGVVRVWSPVWEVTIVRTWVTLLGLLAALVAFAGCTSSLDRAGWHLDFGISAEPAASQPTKGA